MRTIIPKYYLMSVAVAALLAACDGSHLPVGAPGAMPMHAPFGDAGNLRSLASRNADGAKYPKAPLIKVGSILYGTTNNGGTFRNPKTCQFGCGTVFSITTSGVIKVLHSFGGAGDGKYPAYAGLLNVKGTLYGTTSAGGGKYPAYAGLLNVKGTLYGTTSAGGAYGTGTIFSITTDGVENVLHSFGGTGDGADPMGGTLIKAGAKLYGTTWSGGAYGSSDSGSRICPHISAAPGCGTVFSITTSGTEQVLHSFGNGNDGMHPWAGLIAVGDTLYGTTFFGGIPRSCPGDEGNGCGTVFSITTRGSETVLHRFGKGHDGMYPQAPLLRVHSGIYGTTSEGGSETDQGTVFVITTDGVEKVLYRFATQGGSSDAAVPISGLTNVKGTLYGTTYYGGGCQEGTVYSVTTTGVEKVLHGFCNGINDGSTPWAGLLNVGGLLYGTTWLGGGHLINCGHHGHPTGCGTVYSITTVGQFNLLYRFH